MFKTKPGKIDRRPKKERANIHPIRNSSNSDKLMLILFKNVVGFLHKCSSRTREFSATFHSLFKSNSQKLGNSYCDIWSQINCRSFRSLPTHTILTLACGALVMPLSKKGKL